MVATPLALNGCTNVHLRRSSRVLLAHFSIAEAKKHFNLSYMDQRVEVNAAAKTPLLDHLPFSKKYLGAVPRFLAIE